MKNTGDEKITELIEMIHELPKEAQKAICWIAGNMDLVEKLCKFPDITYQEIQQDKEEALAQKDYLLYCLLHFQQVYMDNSPNKTKNV